MQNITESPFASAVSRQDSSQVESQAAETLAQVIRDNEILLIDAGALLSAQFPLFWEHLLPLLEKEGRALLIPSITAAELEALMQTPESKSYVLTVLGLLSKGERKGCVRWEGSNGYPTFPRLVRAFRETASLMVITQDDMRALCLSQLNDAFPDCGKAVTVRRINPDSTMAPHEV